MRTTIQAVALSVIAMIAGDARATHRTTPFLMEIPFQTSSTDPSVPPQALGIQEFRPFSQGESARWISFDSTSDLMGNGSSGSEIFIFDNELPRSLSQVTQCAVGENTNPANTANGKTVVFESTGNISAPVSTRCTQLLPARRIMRAQFNQGVWAYDELTGGLGPADCSEPTITAEGFRVAFQCAGDLRRSGSPGTNIYLWRNDLVCDFQASPPCSKVQQITPPGDWVSGNVEFNLLSTKLVFNSNAPIGGPSNGSQQIYLYEIATNAPFPQPIRLTNGVGDSTNPSMNQDGRLVVFQSAADLLGNGSTGSELFLLDRQTGVLRQLTDGDGESTLPSMGGGGRYIIFLSTGAVAGGGIGAAQVYLYDLIDEQLYQVTNGGSAGNPIATSDTIFFFDSDGDPLGLGLTGRHVYALNVFRQLPPRALGPSKFRLLPGKEVAPGSGRVSGSSVRIVNASTFNADPATTHTEFPIGNQSLGAGELNLAILGRSTAEKEGHLSPPDRARRGHDRLRRGPLSDGALPGGPAGRARLPDPPGPRHQPLLAGTPRGRPLLPDRVQGRLGVPGAPAGAAGRAVLSLQLAARRVRGRAARRPGVRVRHPVSGQAARVRSPDRRAAGVGCLQPRGAADRSVRHRPSRHLSLGPARQSLVRHRWGVSGRLSGAAEV
jgi:hypothetical protein